ncbi:Peptidase family S41 [Pedobacter westerhofensis]|uniref:Peptidase family S41 n=2 Tax=Pedobacter westerhofensis TaxID=425512 RepID=A0A521D518_9SPHI|nr:Peptidase family S41 [Pedobacter westerhofensis]
MMPQKIILFISFILVFRSQEVFCQDFKNQEIKFLVDSTITIMRKNSVNSNKVDWTLLRKNVMLKAANLSSPYQLGDVIRYLFRSLDDFHGAFFYRDSVFKYNRKESPISDSIKNEWNKRSGIKTGILKDNIGYLRIPSMPGGSKSTFDSLAQNLNDSLCSLLTQHIKGIIVDLRINGGGAMYPMILGLEQLLQREAVGSFLMKTESKWFLKDHNFYIDTTKLASIAPKCWTATARLPMVMLTSPATGSSGEFLIIAFKGRPNTIIIGNSTAGYVTANQGFKINDEAFLNLSVGYGKDRNGKTYFKAIRPDISISSPDKFNDLENDRKILAAAKWLTK